MGALMIGVTAALGLVILGVGLFVLEKPPPRTQDSQVQPYKGVSTGSIDTDTTSTWTHLLDV
jgi:hypothetical protein